MHNNALESDFEYHYGKNGVDSPFAARLANPDNRFLWALKRIDGSVLDVGCADGLFMKIMKDRNISEVAGYDASLKARNSAKANANVPVFSALDIIKPSSYDTVVCLQTLEHSEHPGLLFKNMASIARKKIIFSVPIDNMIPDKMHKHLFSIYSVVRLICDALGEDADYDIHMINKIDERMPPNIFAVVVRLGAGKNDDKENTESA